MKEKLQIKVTQIKTKKGKNPINTCQCKISLYFNLKILFEKET